MPASARPATAAELADAVRELEAVLFDRGPSRTEAAALASASVALAELPESERPPGLDPVERLENARLLALAGGYEEGLPWLSERIVVRLMHADALERAREIIEEDLALVEDRGFRVRQLMRLAQIARTQGRLDEAEGRVEEAAAELGEDGDPSMRALLLGTRVELSLALGLRDRAARENLEELRLVEELRSGSARARLHRADVLLAIGQLDRAKTYASALLESDEAWGDAQRASLRLNGALADAEEARQGRVATGTASAELRAALDDPALSEGNRELAELALADLLLLLGEAQEAGELLAREPGAGAPSRARLESSARRAALRHRHAALVGDADARKQALAELESAWSAFLDSWRGLEPRAEGLGFLEYGSRRIVVSELVRATIAESGSPAAALARVLEAMEAGSFARRQAYRSRPLSEVVAMLAPPGSGLLVYLGGHDETHVFAADREAIVHDEAVGPRRLWELGRDWRSMLDAPPRSDVPQGREPFLAAGRALAEELLPPAVRERVAGWSSVTIVGQSFLGSPPFEFLPFGAGFLGDERSVAELPSLPVGVILRERAALERSLEADLFLVADPAFGPDALASVEPLPFERRHLERLTRGFAPDRVRVVLGDEAHRASLLDPLVSRSRVLHLFTHGIDLPDRWRAAGAVLAPAEEGDDGFLDCEFVETRMASAPVVLLSACRAGSGRTKLGDDGPAHLGGAFLEAGARAVVLSPVALELEAQCRFGELVHARLLAGDAVAEAVRFARTSLGQERPWAHPYFRRVRVLGLGDTRPFARDALPR